MIDNHAESGCDQHTGNESSVSIVALKKEAEALKLQLRAQQKEIDALKWVQKPAASPAVMFKTLFEGASAAIFCADAESGIILDCNACACDLIGREYTEIIGMHQTKLHPPGLFNVYCEQFREHVSLTSVKNCEAEVQHKDGRIIPVIISSMPVILEGRKILIGFFVDITEQKRTEDALRESEDKFKAIFDRAAMGITIADRNGYIRDCNLAYEQMLGYSLEELRQKRFVDITHPEDVGRNLALQRQLAEGLIDKYHIEKRYIRKNGEPFWCSLISSAICENGTFKYGVGVVENINDRKHADEELKTAKARAELYLDLMGHDINNLNQIALGYLEFIGSQLPDEDLRQMFSRPGEAIMNSSKLIDNVRKLQKITTGNKIIPVRPTDVLEQACLQFSETPGVCLSLDSSGTAASTVMADELLIDVFTNILGNAIKHCGREGDLQVNVKQVEISDKGTRYCKIMIEDNGPGVPDGRKGHIFDWFSRASTKSKGSGLGLYLVKSLVDSYHGKVWVEDRVPGDHSRGAKFVILLPAVEQ